MWDLLVVMNSDGSMSIVSGDSKLSVGRIVLTDATAKQKIICKAIGFLKLPNGTGMWFTGLMSKIKV